MKLGRSLRIAWVVLALLAAVPFADAAIISKLDLAEMTNNADRIFRGRVTDIEQSSVSVGGGDLPAVIVRMEVDDVLKGSFSGGKGGQVVEVKMLGTVKDAPVTAGSAQRIDILPDLPRLTLGGDYLLFTTEPSPLGLSTTVGLGQGSFRIYADGTDELASNELNNAGLFTGPVTYGALTAAIQAELGQ